MKPCELQRGKDVPWTYICTEVLKGQTLTAGLKFEIPNSGHVLIIPHLPTPWVFACQSSISIFSDLLLALILAIQRYSGSDPWLCSDLGSCICSQSETCIWLQIPGPGLITNFILFTCSYAILSATSQLLVLLPHPSLSAVLLASILESFFSSLWQDKGSMLFISLFIQRGSNLAHV